MLVKTIAYKSLDGTPREGVFYFHLGEADLVKLKLSGQGGLEAKLRRIVQDMDGDAIIEEFERILELSYGVRSDDGQSFEKSPELWRKFRGSPAYDVLFMELVTSASFASEFIRAVVPSDLSSQVDTSELDAISRQFGIEPAVKPVVVPSDAPAWIREDREPTNHELAGMTRPQLMQAMKAKEERKRKLADTPPELVITDQRPAWLRERREATVEELEGMNDTEFTTYQSWIANR